MAKKKGRKITVDDIDPQLRAVMKSVYPGGEMERAYVEDMNTMHKRVRKLQRKRKTTNKKEKDHGNR